MKKAMAVLAILLAAAHAGQAQTINWRSLRDDHRDLIHLSAGYDYGATAQLGYSRSIDFVRPVILGLDYSFPMGRDLFDDFKVRLGGQMEVMAIGGFSASVKIASVFRRQETALVRIASFGSDFAILTGFYQRTWFVAGEFGFDKAITSHLKHSDVMRASFPGIRDGWYVPTGGNFYYGIEGGGTIGGIFDLTMRIGATQAQAHDENAVIPLYLQVGVGMRP
jgi:hypothetical protein